jgi:hypothetical protein
VSTVDQTSAGIAVVGEASVVTGTPAEFSRNASSFFADPAAWLLVAAVEQALADCPEPVLAAPDEVGVIVVSDRCTLLTMDAIAATAARGLVSPLRFAGANPGVLAGLPCIVLGLRGPTLVLTMDPADGAGPATAVAASWLRAGQARHLLLAVYSLVGGGHVARCLILRAAAPGERDACRDVPGLLTAIGREADATAR